jgi:mannose-6-phosphate isomerase-like protein (cupin superfamily)
MSSNTINRRKLMQLLSATFAGSLFTSSKMFARTPIPAVFPGDAPKPVYIPPGGGEKGKIGLTEITFKLSKEQTSGNLGSSEMVLQPGYLGAPPHLHRGFDEICLVLQGTLHIMVGDEVYEVDAGGWHLRPRGIMHTFWNSGKVPVRFVELYSPAGHEAYMKDLAKLFENNHRPTSTDLQKLAERHDIEFHFDKLPAIIKKYGVQL